MTKYYVLMVNETGADDSVIYALKNIEAVKTAHGTFGPYDVIAKLESDDETKIEKDVLYRVRRLPQTRSTLTLKIDEGKGFRKTNKAETEVLEKHMAQAFAIIHCNHSQESQVIENLNKIPEIIEANILIGSYEILCKIVGPSYNEISDVMTNKIRKIPNIKSTITLNIVENQGFQK